jgi:predicted HicB family RNase H-like nuclease
MVDNVVKYTLRIDRELFRKFRFIAEYNGRSANREIEQYMKRRVKEFEEKHGVIEGPSETQ